MKTPFVYGIAAESAYFTDREKETKRLLLNFENGINTIVISPRRWGKTSLVNKVAELMKDNQQVRVVRMDAFSVRTPEDFYRMFATELIKQTATRAEEWMELNKGNKNEAKEEEDDYNYSVYNISIAKDKKIRLVICIDEFQQIGELSDSITFQKKLRSVWQHQHSVSYCLYGSKRHLLMNMFGQRSYPFYKFGDVLFLERIPIEYWQEYIQQRFEQAEKHISATFVEDIYSYVDGNSSYVQQLSWLVWMRTDNDVSEEIITDAKQELLRQNHALFMEQINSLTVYQIRFIRAIMVGKAQEVNRKETIEEFELGSSANVATIKKALQKKELIEIEGKQIYFSDPIFIHWLHQNSQLFT